MAINPNRIGEITQIFPEKAMARVHFDDVEMLSDELHILVKRAIGTKDYWMPKVGDKVLCMFVDDNTGFVVGSWYADDEPLPCDVSPSRSDDIRAVELENGSKFTFDVKNNNVTIDCTKDISITLLDNVVIHMPIDKDITILKDLPAEV